MSQNERRYQIRVGASGAHSIVERSLDMCSAAGLAIDVGRRENPPFPVVTHFELALQQVRKFGRNWLHMLSGLGLRDEKTAPIDVMVEQSLKLKRWRGGC
jgi:hypothetical protein